ncbi:two component response regulator, LytTr family [Janthinobacterium sp. HH01]|uniref:LytR/AlgR family response regulator transcription factor n=1 Tax=Janthinobacterium sp. HH01 TaxID=1198452 RepID=UPI0002AE95F4|nr:LytTR family DNA-binding domain-containing protein [Janthinobacterium sp. HH01]ELX12211.1 two component response regulator, LytTr family [Janthinobacterium sp. HH01]
MTRALIADDEPHLALYLKEQLELLWPDLQIVHLARNGVEAAALIEELEPDLAFLDIQMPGLSGLEVAQGIEGNTRVVFVTAFDTYAVQAFDHCALDYLLKPLKTDRLALMIERVKATLALQAAGRDAQPDARLSQALQQLTRGPAAPSRLRFVRAGQGEYVHQIAVSDVLYFHADDKYTVVQSTGGEHLIRTTISELCEQLDPEQFWQVHRSTLVNLDYLAGTRRDDSSRLFLRIKGHARELRVSRAYVHLFRAM